MDGYIAVYLHAGILYSNENEETISLQNTMNESHKCKCEGKKPDSEVSNLQPVGHTQPRLAVNVAHHKIINSLIMS